jgi:hypothetical protein
MYAEIGTIKKIAIAQYNNHVHLYCNAITSKMWVIVMKDSTVYMDNSFVRDIFQKLKHESLPLDFRSYFTSLERPWQMNKEKVTSQSLMADACSYYTNVAVSDDWELEVNKHAQIIALTMQLLKLKQEMSQIKTSTKPSGDANKPLNEAGDKRYVIQEWRLTKVENGNVFNMVKTGGTKYWWCDNHKHPESDHAGMYVFHKPSEHDAWKQRKNDYNKKRGKCKSDANIKAPSGPSSVTPVASSSSASKLSLAKSLQEALTTMAGLSEDQFNKIWENACNALRN